MQGQGNWGPTRKGGESKQSADKSRDRAEAYPAYADWVLSERSIFPVMLQSEAFQNASDTRRAAFFRMRLPNGKRGIFLKNRKAEQVAQLPFFPFFSA